MKKLLLLLVVTVSGCVNIPPEKIHSTSSQTLCDAYVSRKTSEENKVMIEEELKSRGLNCTRAQSSVYAPPPAYKQPTVQVPIPKTTNCHAVGNTVQCTTY